MNSLLLIGPTLINPELIDTVEALRHELHQANSTLLQQFDKLVSYDALARQITEILNQLLILNRQQDQEGIAKLLDDYLVSRPKLREQIDKQCIYSVTHRVH